MSFANKGRHALPDFYLFDFIKYEINNTDPGEPEPAFADCFPFHPLQKEYRKWEQKTGNGR